MLVYFLIGSPWGRRHARPLTMLWLVLPQVMICWMIGLTDGVDSIYFVGLHLAFYAVGIIVPISYGEGVAFGLFTCLAYGVACIWQNNGIPALGRFTGNMLFISFSATISVACSYFAELSRLRMFGLREQVAMQNMELQQTNGALAQVKGQLIQQEKMAALGTLSAGLLHEVNNPVNYSMMALNMALLEPEVDKSATLKESITDARDGMQRVQHIVTDLKTFAYQKPGESPERVFLMEKSVQSALRLTGFELKGIKTAIDLPMDTHVLGDEPALIGVLINLFSNAALALRKEGAQAVTPRIDIKAHREGGRMYVAVRDNGMGIKPENLSRVFEPFFTTRDVGQGLGLGLSMCYAIIQRHGGTLSVASEEGAWTEFSFDLALANTAA
jgi:two-component system sensor histidine kinase PhcS